MEPSCPETAEWQEIANGFTKFYNERSPILFTLVAAAILEDQVLRTLQKTVPALRRDRGMSHYLRVSLLRDMGIVTSSVAESLKCFARIRNAFAHHPHTTTLEDEEIVLLAQKLRKQLEFEAGKSGLLSFESTRSMLESKFHAGGMKVPWPQPVAGTLIAGYFALTYYLIWARHWAPAPPRPKNINEIGKHVCTKKK